MKRDKGFTEEGGREVWVKIKYQVFGRVWWRRSQGEGGSGRVDDTDSQEGCFIPLYHRY